MKTTRWLTLSDNQTIEILERATTAQLDTIIQFAPYNEKIPLPHITKKHERVSLLLKLIKNEEFRESYYSKLSSEDSLRYIYQRLIWRDRFLTIDSLKEIDNSIEIRANTEKLDGKLRLINISSKNFYKIVMIDYKIRDIMKFFFILPDDYHLIDIKNPTTTKYTYSNEDNILDFVTICKDMTKHDLIAFSKSNEKPLSKTLNLLKNTTSIVEFYDKKKINFVATDMLTRTFYFHFLKEKTSSNKPLELLGDSLARVLNDSTDFTLSRILLSHLKKVRYDRYFLDQSDLFKTTIDIIGKMRDSEWIEFKNILNYCRYTDVRIDIESNKNSLKYFMKTDKDSQFWNDEVGVDQHYEALMLEPMVKGVFFYLASLGVVELKYNDPVSSYSFAQEGEPYISLFDSLIYIKLTNLGRYLVGFTEKYTEKKILTKVSTVAFDEYKPIISLEPDDIKNIAKIEPYTEIYDTNKYILSHSKIFKNCQNIDELNIKLKNFDNIFSKKAPLIFDTFFKDILANTNALKDEPSDIVISINNNKKLIQLFMTNKKIQAIITKASGYKIIVKKEDLSKLTKIIKENGFFIEF